MSAIIEFAEFEDFQADDAPVSVCTIELPNGKRKVYRLGHLGYVAYNEIIATVPPPAVPTHVVLGKREPNEADPDYRVKLASAVEKRRLLLLTASLEQGGMVIPGDTLEAKAQRIGRYPTAIIGALLMGFTQAHHGLAGRLEQLADTFLGVPDTGAESAPALGTEDAG